MRAGPLALGADKFSASIGLAPSAHHFRRQLHGAKFRQRQVAAVAVQVLAQVAQNIGELKRDAPLHGQLDGFLPAETPDAYAHQTNRARDLVAKFTQLGP